MYTLLIMVVGLQVIKIFILFLLEVLFFNKNSLHFGFRGEKVIKKKKGKQHKFVNPGAKNILPPPISGLNTLAIKENHIFKKKKNF